MSSRCTTEHLIRPACRPAHRHAPELQAKSVEDLLSIIGLGAGAPVALYGSSGTDTRPLVFLTPEAIALRAGPGLAPLGLAPPLAPALHIRINRRMHGASYLDFNNGQSRISRIERPRRVRVGSAEGRLIRVLVESSMPGWGLQAPYVLDFAGGNEEIGPHLAALGLRPEIFVGVSDGCAGFGDNPPELCVNRLCRDSLGRNFSAGTYPKWVVADHLTPSADVPGCTHHCFETGRIYASSDSRVPVALRAVARMSTAWGHYGSDGAWLFHCQYDIGGTH